PTPAAPSLGVAGMNEDSSAPCLEAVRVPQLGQLAPDGQERVLHGVLCEADVAQDPVGHHEQPVAHLMHQAGKGVAVAPLGSPDEVSIHVDLCGAAPHGASYSL